MSDKLEYLDPITAAEAAKHEWEMGRQLAVAEGVPIVKSLISLITNLRDIRETDQVLDTKDEVVGFVRASLDKGERDVIVCHKGALAVLTRFTVYRSMTTSDEMARVLGVPEEYDAFDEPEDKGGPYAA